VTRFADSLVFLAEQLADPDHHWSLGTFGALAEFTRDAGEPVAISRQEDSLAAVTARGGIRIAPLPEMRFIASETPTRASWNHRVALCLPASPSAMNRRRVLTELGPDSGALRAQDRGAILFDLGLEGWQVDACIRVADPKIVAALRRHLGRAVFEAGNPVMGIIVPASPHRVFISRLGRIEVFQPIPPPDGRSPEGPHTHVLPKLLQHRRTHAATEPIPDGLVPCAHLYPAHPIKDGLGRPLQFDAQRYQSFERLLDRYGDPDAVKLKRRVIDAIRQGSDPSTIRIPDDRTSRASIRVALRQFEAAHQTSPTLMAWLNAHDRAHVADDEDAMIHGQG